LYLKNTAIEAIELKGANSKEVPSSFNKDDAKTILKQYCSERERGM
jgi:hypothetical protein